MEYSKLSVADIMQPNILYYDEKIIEACIDICSYLKIDNLPAIDGKHFYKFGNLSFKKYRINELHRTSIDTPIFSENIFSKFSKNKHDVLFVFFGDTLCGVVHISDYNRNIVLQKVQDDLLMFERNLRQLILLHGKNNFDMLRYFEYRLESGRKQKDKDFYHEKILRYQRMENEIKSLGPFQLFEFTDLLSFCNSSFSGKIFPITQYEFNEQHLPTIDILKWLRNLAMHGKNPVGKNEDESIFSIESLQNFRNSLYVLEKEMSKINFLIRNNHDFITSLKLENRSKLNIIHSHHPRALEYFLGMR